MSDGLIKQTGIALKFLEDNLKEIVPMTKCPNCGRKLKPKENFWNCSKCHNDFFTSGNKRRIYIWNPNIGKPLLRSGIPEGEWEEFKPNEVVTFT